jgi:hypothetical protein
MKKIIGILLSVVFVTILLAHSSYSGYTRKSGSGCTCHGSANSSVVVEITGPSQVSTGATTTYQVTISGGSGTAVCVDIAASAGTLSAYDSALKTAGSELISNGTKTYTSGKYKYSFNYTAPTTAGKQTLYATGLPSKNTGWNFAPDKSVEIMSTAGIEVEQNLIPREFMLSQNFPNPFNPSTVINFTVPFRQYMTGQVLDIQGKIISELVNDQIDSGTHQVVWNAQNIATGIYFFRLQSGNSSKTIKLLYLK